MTPRDYVNAIIVRNARARRIMLPRVVIAITIWGLLSVVGVEARPRDPVGGFFKALTGQATWKRSVTKRPKAEVKRVSHGKSAKTSIKFRQVPSLVVRSDPVNGKLMAGATDKFDPPLSWLYRNFPIVPMRAWSESGMASWYGPGFHGRQTACGNIYNEWSMTAAHKTLKCGTVVEVHSGGKSVDVTIRDRGPFIRGRIIDLSKGAAQALGMLNAGVARVTIYPLVKE